MKPTKPTHIINGEAVCYERDNIFNDKFWTVYRMYDWCNDYRLELDEGLEARFIKYLAGDKDKPQYLKMLHTMKQQIFLVLWYGTHRRRKIRYIMAELLAEIGAAYDIIRNYIEYYGG